MQAPASVTSSDGLGPLFNATSCSACHFKDGRGAPPASPDDAMLGLLLRLGVPGEDEHGGPALEPTYGGQFHHHAIAGIPAEGSARVEYEELKGVYADGEPYSLRRPTYVMEDLAYGDMDDETLVSPRVAPVMVGLGLVEAIPEEAIVAGADEGDSDGDGISGRPNRVWDPAAAAAVLGRLGWNANQPDMRQQVSGAFSGDMGITSSLHPAPDCTAAEVECAAAPNGGEPEISDEKLDRVVLHCRTLAVPARRDADDPDVVRGKALFRQAGCAKCHTESFQTGPFDRRGQLDRARRHGPRGPIPAYHAVDLNLRYTHAPTGLSASLAIENLLDDVAIVSRRPDGIFTGGFRQIIGALRWEWPAVRAR